VEGLDPAPYVPAPSRHGSMTARDQPIQVAVHGLPGPISLGSGEVGSGPPVEGCHGQDLSRCEAVELAPAGQCDQVLQPVPVVTTPDNKLLGTHQVVKITEWSSRSPTLTSSSPLRSAFRSTTRWPGWAPAGSRRSSTC